MAQHKPQQRPSPKTAEPLLPENITGPERELLERMYNGYIAYRVGRKATMEAGVREALRVVSRFLGHVGKIPGQLVPADFDNWALHLVRNQGISPATQRTYYANVRLFFGYLLESMDLRNRARQLFDADIVQVVTAETGIPHKNDNETALETNRRAFLHRELIKFFDGLDSAIAFYQKHGTRKTVVALLRDKALFLLMYACGLRPREVTLVNLTSFEPNPDFPEFGDFGFVRIFGKGRKWRTVPILLPMVAPVLQLYRDGVRLMQLESANSDPNEQAFFLSEHGTRMSTSAVRSRFNRTLLEAGMLDTKHVPHNLRHSAVTHGGMAGLDLESLRQMVGHVFLATTQGYFSVPDGFVKDDFSAAIQRGIDASRKKKE